MFDTTDTVGGNGDAPLEQRRTVILADPGRVSVGSTSGRMLKSVLGVSLSSDTDVVSDTTCSLYWIFVVPFAVSRSRVGPIQTASNVRDSPVEGGGLKAARSMLAEKLPSSSAVTLTKPSAENTTVSQSKTSGCFASLPHWKL